ncbi:tRNA (adenine(22)-N(1))-methyltransferase, partial [Aerococcus sp. L_4]
NNLQQELTSDDILFGLFNKEKYAAIFQEKWQLELKRTNYVLDQLEQASNRDESKIARYQELKAAIQAQLA